MSGPTAAEVLFARGERTVADLIAPAAVEVTRDALRLERQYARTLVVTGYPRTVGPGWLAPLVELDEALELSMHVAPLETAPAVRALSHKLVQFESSRHLTERGGRLADPEREVAASDVEHLRDALQRGEERAFSVSLYLLLRAADRDALDDLTLRVEAALDGMLAQCRVALFEQDSGFHACLPQAQDRLQIPRNLDTTSLVMSFPFCTSTLSMDRGVLYGIDRQTHAPVLIDPFDPSLENANLAVIAPAGSGKSYFTKLLALRALLLGVEFLVIDPEDEYRRVCQAVDGQHVRLAATGAQRLNPFDLPVSPVSGGVLGGPRNEDGPEREAGWPGGSTREDASGPEGADGQDPLAEQIVGLLGLLELMVAAPGESLTARERAALDRALTRTYAGAGITHDPATHGRPAPLLRDLHAVLETMATEERGQARGETAADLAEQVHPYAHGSLSGLFSGPTNVALDKHLVVFDVQALEPALRAVAIHAITAFVWGRVRRSRRPRLLVVDEAWSLLRYPQGAAFLEGVARRARKHWLGLVTISQGVPEFLASVAGRAVLANAAMKLLLKQDQTGVDAAEEVLALTPEDRQFLLAAGKGEGLFFARGAHVPITIEASPEEHLLATTAPAEVAALAARHGRRS